MPPTLEWFRYGSWLNGRDVWGNHRIFLEPHENTNTRGRSGFFIHGGRYPGSIACIDLIDQMDNLAKWFKGYGKDIVLDVKYED